LKASPTLIIVIILKIILSTKATEKGVTKFYLYDSHQKEKKEEILFIYSYV